MLRLQSALLKIPKFPKSVFLHFRWFFYYLSDPLLPANVYNFFFQEPEPEISAPEPTYHQILTVNPIKP